MKDTDLWAEEFKLCSKLDLFNSNCVQWALGTPRFAGAPVATKEYKAAVHTEARRRGYKWNATSKSYEMILVAPDDYQRSILELARKHKHERIRGKMLSTRIAKVTAYWECSSADETGILVIQDGRKSFVEHVWDGVPEELYHRLFAHDAKDTLTQILTMFKGREMDEHKWLEANFETYAAN